jgi:hypothetical protein
MNFISAETQLLIVVVFFYVYDASLLLFANEGIVICHRRHWTATTNRNGLSLRGKNLFIPNLLFPHQPIYRLAWYSEKIEQTSTVDWVAEKSLYLWFAFPAYGMAITLFIIAPTIYHLFRSNEALLWCLGLIYYLSIVAGVGLFLHKGQLGLSSKKALSLFVECLFCPPLTINIVRKLSLLRPIRANFVESAFQLLDSKRWIEIRSELVTYIEAEMDETDLADEIARLVESKEIILGMNK